MKKLVLFIVSLCMMNVAFATIRYVSPSGPYLTIMSAVLASIPGDIIQVSAGTYTESILIYKNNLTIIGAGPNSTVIKTIGSVPAVTLSANNFVISNLKITHNFRMKEGIRVNWPAYQGLTVRNVNFTNISNDNLNAPAINVTTSFAYLSLDQCNFTGTAASTRAMAVYGAKNILHNNWSVQNCSFTKLYTGIYLNSSINGLTLELNTFGPWDLSDCRQAAAGLYIGDGGPGFSIDNVTVTNNTFVSFARGVYFLNNAENGMIGTTEISQNEFTNSIYSSAVRIVAGTEEAGVYTPAILEGPVTVSNNNIAQGEKIVSGDGVAMIDFRTVTGAESPTSNIAVVDNNISFTATFDVATWGVLLRGPMRLVNIDGNTFSGTPSGSSPNMPPTTAVCIQTDYLDYGPMSSGAAYNIKHNSITNFVYGVTAYNMLTKTYGGIPAGAVVAVNSNTIADNTYGIFTDFGEYIDATNNFWGNESGPAHVTNPGGTGNPVTDYVNFLPFYQVVPNTIVAGTIDPLDSTCYNAAEVITVAGEAGPFLVSNEGYANFIAGSRIFFMPGTTVVAGGYLHGSIAPSGPFCPPDLTKKAGSTTVFSMHNDASFKAFPNPTTGQFTLIRKGNESFTNVTMTISDLRGNIILRQELSGDKIYTFSISDQPGGLYLLRLVSDNESESIKLIKTE